MCGAGKVGVIFLGRLDRLLRRKRLRSGAGGVRFMDLSWRCGRSLVAERGTKLRWNGLGGGDPASSRFRTISSAIHSLGGVRCGQHPGR